MKHLKKLLCTTVITAMIFAFAGCGAGTQENSESANETGNAQQTTENNSEIHITDMTGREVILDKPAEKIVALTASDCEIIFELGAQDLLVGRGEYCIYPEEALEIPSVQSGYETNIEQIISLAPDVLIMDSMNQSEEQVNQLQNAGIQVIVLAAQDIDGVYEAIDIIGTVTGKEAEADALCKEMQDSFKALQDKAASHADEGEKTVYFEVSPLEYGLWTAGNNTFMNEIAEMLGVKNCFDDVTGWGEISEEQVLSRNPDYIVTITMYYGEGPTPAEEILGRTGWDQVTAVKNEKILNLTNDELSKPSHSLVDGAEELYNFIYGQE